MILTIMMILALLPALPAKAADPFLLVVDTEIDLTKNGTYLDGKVEYDAATHTLTLNDLEPTQHKNVISAGSLGFVLTIKGSSKLTNEFDAAINVDGDLIIDGDFECYSGYQKPIIVNGNLTVNGGSLEVTRWSYGDALNVGGDLTVNGGSLKAERPSGVGYALNVEGNLTVNGGSLEAKDSGTGIALKVEGDLTVNGGSLKAEQSGIGTSLSVTGNLIVNGGSLEAQKSGEDGNNLYIGNSLTLNNGERFVVGDENANEIRIAQAFLVRFVNDDEDQTELQSGYVEKDITPSYTGNTPTKEADAQYTYTFAGWDPEVAEVTGDAIYTAKYDATGKECELSFDLGGGALDGQTGKITMKCRVGDTINLPGTPAKEGYKFLYWKGSEYAAGAEYTVDGPHDFTAEWEEVKEEQETKQDTSPKTGDHNKAGLWAALMGGALLVVIAAIVADRKYLKKQR